MKLKVIRILKTIWYVAVFMIGLFNTGIASYVLGRYFRIPYILLIWLVMFISGCFTSINGLKGIHKTIMGETWI